MRMRLRELLIVKWLLHHYCHLTEWEQDFIHSLSVYRKILMTTLQMDKLNEIYETYRIILRRKRNE